ncbi:MAG: hypothetical protein K2X66_09450 [Cyanobacteria bacterium]|nr:hypothetical protein [Cyanobacteriota bacterium]
MSKQINPFILGVLGLILLQTSVQWVAPPVARAGLEMVNPLAKTDVVNLHNGQVVRGRLLSSPGELIWIRNELGQETVIRRLEVNTRQDMIVTVDNKIHYGEIEFIDAYKVFLRSPLGKQRIWRLKIKSMMLGAPNELRRFGGNDENLDERYTPNKKFVY